MNWIGKAGEKLAELHKNVLDGGRIGSQYFETEPRRPTMVGFEPGLPPNIYGVQIDNLKCIGVFFNPEIVYEGPRLAESVAMHEGVHTAQPPAAKKNLSNLYVIVKGYPFPLGTALLEGGVDYVLEKSGKAYTNSYRHYTKIAKHVDEKYGLGKLYKTAEREPNTLVKELERLINTDPQLRMYILEAANYDMLRLSGVFKEQRN